NGVVPVEPLGHEALQCASNRNFVSQRDLTLDHRMKGRVRLYVREANARAPVILLDYPDALMFIHCAPFFRFGSLKRIVPMHDPVLVDHLDVARAKHLAGPGQGLSLGSSASFVAAG